MSRPTRAFALRNTLVVLSCESAQLVMEKAAPPADPHVRAEPGTHPSLPHRIAVLDCAYRSDLIGKSDATGECRANSADLRNSDIPGLGGTTQRTTKVYVANGYVI